tara:strand:+ start:461 stop:1342 length:882 start_codon:yes stop_codon:yes gene_type:complete
MIKNLSDQRKGIFLSLIGILIITPDSLFIRLVKINSWDLVFYRGIIPFFLLLIGLIIFYKKNFFNAVFMIGYAGLINALIVALTNITFVFSLENTDVANTLVMLSLAPFMAAFLSIFLLKEYPKKRTWIAMILCFIFVLFIFHDSYQSGKIVGDIFGFITAFLVGASSVVIRIGKLANFLPSLMIAKFFTMFFTIFFVKSLYLEGADIYLIPIMCVFFVTLPLAFLTLAPRYIPAHEVELFFVLETTLGPIWVWLIIRETPSLETIIGGSLIISTLLIHTILELKKQNSKIAN